MIRGGAILLFALGACARSDGAAADRPSEMQAPADETSLVGQPAQEWELAEWDGAPPTPLAALRGCAVVVRFWSDGCPYCERSLPALDALARRYATRPVRFVGIFHAKPRGREADWREAVATARAWGATFPLANDRGWHTVDRWWLDGFDRAATSATFVIDANGKIAHVHPGPVFEASGADADARRGYAELEAAVERAAETAPGC